jgi:hypothetical protein
MAGTSSPSANLLSVGFHNLEFALYAARILSNCEQQPDSQREVQATKLCSPPACYKVRIMYGLRHAMCAQWDPAWSGH